MTQRELKAACPPGLPTEPDRSGNGDLSLVPVLLDVRDRVWPVGDVRSASVRGLWLCTRSSLKLEDWFRRKTAALNLIEGEDFREIGGELYIDLTHVPGVLHNMGGPMGVEAARFASEAVRALHAETKRNLRALRALTRQAEIRD